MHTASLLALLLLFSDDPPRPKETKSPFARWEKAIAAIEKRDKANPPSEHTIFFCGSSSIVGWNLTRSFPDLKVSNRGFGGSQIADSTHFAPRIIHPSRPATIVFYAGDNDIASGKSPEKVRADFQGFVKVVHDRLPKTRILFLSIKPSIKRWKLIEQIRKANALIEADCKKDVRLVFVDVGTGMLGSDGKPKPDLLAADGLHLSAAGYRMWSDVVRKHLEGAKK